MGSYVVAAAHDDDKEQHWQPFFTFSVEKKGSQSSVQ